MALDKLVDSTQLDADLTTVANAIRAKGGASGQLAFPSGMASAIADIPTGGTLQSKTLTLGASAPATVSPDAGYDGLSSVPVSIDSSVIKAENIAEGVTMLGIEGSHAGGGGGDDYLEITYTPASDIANPVITHNLGYIPRQFSCFLISKTETKASFSNIYPAVFSVISDTITFNSGVASVHYMFFSTSSRIGAEYGVTTIATSTDLTLFTNAKVFKGGREYRIIIKKNAG